MRERFVVNVISIGEVLWDVVGDTEHFGGAPLNFAANMAKLGHAAYMVSAVGIDDRGHRALSRIQSLGLTTDYIACNRECETGHVTVELDAKGQPSFTIHRPAAYDSIELAATQLQRLSSLTPEWIYFGTLAQTSAKVHATTEAIIAAAPAAKRFYDVNLRDGCYDRQTVDHLLKSASFAKLNDAEVGMVESLLGGVHHQTHEDFCRDFAQRFGWLGACVTRGSAGCALLLKGAYIESPAYLVKVADSIGAGDAFAAGLVHAMSAGFEIEHTADFANRLGGLVASRPGATPAWTLQELERLPELL